MAQTKTVETINKDGTKIITIFDENGEKAQETTYTSNNRKWSDISFENGQKKSEIGCRLSKIHGITPFA